MSRKDLQQMLQECLEGYDAGLTPEECLSAYPARRRELEPLLRQALSLRFAYAAQPREEFRLATREKLMFLAGRDVSRALSGEPDPDFVSQTRTRFLNAAGAQAQEALRDVPPPRLPFWANARRRLLETASMSPPRPAAGHALAFSLRSGLSAAVVVVAIAVAAAGFFLQDSPTSDQETASAQLAALEKDLSAIEEQVQSTSPSLLSPGLLDDLAARTSQLVAQIDDEGAGAAEIKAKLPDLINRQQNVVSDAISSGGSGPELAQTQEQLTEAEQKVAVVTALSESPEPTTTTAAVVIAPTQTPQASPTPAATATPRATPDDEDEPEEPAGIPVLIQFDPTDQTQGLNWSSITTERLDLVIPNSWVPDYDVDEDGFAVLRNRLVIIQLGKDAITVSIETGEAVLSQGGVQTKLRKPGPDGEIIAATDLVELRPDDYAVVFHFLTSIEIEGAATPVNATPATTPNTEPTETP